MNYQESLQLFGAHVTYNFLMLTKAKTIPKEVDWLLDYIFSNKLQKPHRQLFINIKIKDYLLVAVVHSLNELCINEKNRTYIIGCFDEFFNVKTQRKIVVSCPGSFTRPKSKSPTSLPE